MMDPSEIIQRASDSGLSLSLEGGLLRVVGPADAVRQWKMILVEHKAAIIKALTPADQLTPSERSLWCLRHQNTWPDGHCPHLEDLEHCELWQAVRHKRTLN